MARQRTELKPMAPAAAIGLMLLAVVGFIIMLWVIIALTRIVFG